MAGPTVSSLPSVTDIQDDNTPNPHIDYIIAFDVLQGLGFLTLVPVILIAWLSPRVQRASTWFPFMLSWVLTSLVNSILIGQQTGPLPIHSVCLVQAALVYATPAMTAATAVAFLVQIYFSIYSAVKTAKPSRVANSRLLFILPGVVFIAIFIRVLVIGVQKPSNVTRSPNGMYCHLADGGTTKVSAVLVIIAMTMVLLFEALAAFMLYRNWTAFQRLSFVDRRVSLSVLIRVAVFGFSPMFVLAISLLTYKRRRTDESQRLAIAVATLPLLAGLVFGTQKDILLAWYRPKRDFDDQSTLVDSDLRTLDGRGKPV